MQQVCEPISPELSVSQSLSEAMGAFMRGLCTQEALQAEMGGMGDSLLVLHQNALSVT